MIVWTLISGGDAKNGWTIEDRVKAGTLDIQRESNEWKIFDELHNQGFLPWNVTSTMRADEDMIFIYAKNGRPLLCLERE